MSAPTPEELVEAYLADAATDADRSPASVELMRGRVEEILARPFGADDELELVVCPVCGARNYWLVEGQRHGARAGYVPAGDCPGRPVIVRYRLVPQPGEGRTE